MNSTPSSIRTACDARMKLGRRTFLNMDFPDTNPSSCRMERSPHDLEKPTTGTSVCLELCTLFPLPGVTINCPLSFGCPNILQLAPSLNFSTSTTYFLDPDSRLLSPIAFEVPCSALFPAVYQTHQGWIPVTPDIHQAPPPNPLPVPPPCRTEDVFREPNYNEGGLYQPDTLDAMQDFLMTPLLCEAVTYKLASQVHNLRPENEHVLGPLDVFPVDAGRRC